ncbi:MAG: hypothetical protein R2742_02375 [Micropruina glycogenica]
MPWAFSTCCSRWRCCPNLMALELFGEQPARTIVYLLLVSVLVGLWIYWRRRPRVGWVPTAMVVVSLIANPWATGPGPCCWRRSR